LSSSVFLLYNRGNNSRKQVARKDHCIVRIYIEVAFRLLHQSSKHQLSGILIFEY